jgi:hypothetical protein
VDECVTLAAELYCCVTAMNWQPGKHVKIDARGSLGDMLLHSA